MRKDDTASPERGADALITLAIVYSLPEAAVIQATLRAHGIPCCALGEAQSAVNWYWTIALGGIAIRIPATARAAATELFPELLERPDRKEIRAAIAAGNGLYARARLLFAHALSPVIFVLCSFQNLSRELSFVLMDGMLPFLAALFELLLAITALFLAPF